MQREATESLEREVNVGDRFGSFNAEHRHAGHKSLPPVIPVLFYTGKRSPYPYSTNWLQEFDDPTLAGKLYTGDFPLAGYLSSPQVISLIHYIIQAGESANAEAFVRELALRVPQHEEELMTIAQQLEQKGIQLGEQRGIEKGEREASLKIARAMLANGLDRDSVMKMTGLTADDLVQIRH
ncbi:hypothetical protein BSQ98_19165 [Serratia liquefaciens]|nr:hypothetical protein BSQ98_19165 [Serratia liquefaciens]